MEPSLINSSAKAGTVGGTLLVLLFKIDSEDLAVSAVLAGTGAVVSYLVSTFLKYLHRRMIRK
jgi:hypothetical protein